VNALFSIIPKLFGYILHRHVTRVHLVIVVNSLAHVRASAKREPNADLIVEFNNNIN